MSTEGEILTPLTTAGLLPSAAVEPGYLQASRRLTGGFLEGRLPSHSILHPSCPGHHQVRLQQRLANAMSPVSLQHVFWIGTWQLGRGWCWWALRTSVPLWFLPPVSWDVPLTPRHVVGPSTLPARTAATHGQALCNLPRQKSEGLLCVSTRLFQRRYFEDGGTCS